MARTRRPRRTKLEVEAAIHSAVLAVLSEVGYSALTFEAVARRAEVSKPVLYRRHSNRVSLVLVAVSATIEATYAEPPDTGDLRSDLLAWLTKSGEMVTEAQSSVLRGPIGKAGDAELERIHALMRERVNDLERCILNPAAQRGEISDDIPASVSRLFFTFIRDRALFGPSTSDDIASFVDEVIMPLLKAHARPTSKPETPY
ncbi:hypothetical protein CJ199_10470 [Brevibacterium paucivorans]|uniref:HTH tetR-type domain-containing protein n=1 Tax=Brevibacterium paucivorans TaxID=170994 RepID=A0A2N6VL74_9MICO|nr:hypothetical protein CJ199_10470 [Brevibacterium paucivorans]